MRLFCTTFFMKFSQSVPPLLLKTKQVKVFLWNGNKKKRCKKPFLLLFLSIILIFLGLNFCFVVYCLKFSDYQFGWLFEWITDWLIDWLMDGRTDGWIWQLIDWLMDWLIDWLIDWLKESWKEKNGSYLLKIYKLWCYSSLCYQLSKRFFYFQVTSSMHET